MPLSQQLRQARDLLSWSVAQAGEHAGLPASVIKWAEAGDGAPDITLFQLARLHVAFEAAGIRFGTDGTVTLDPSASTGRNTLDSNDVTTLEAET